MSEIKKTELSIMLRDAMADLPYEHAVLVMKAADEIERYYTGMLNWKTTCFESEQRLGEEIRELVTALCFWMPKVEGTEGALAERVFKDSHLLAVLDGNLPDDFKTAQDLGWIELSAEANKRDAERYRWLKSQIFNFSFSDEANTRSIGTGFAYIGYDDVFANWVESEIDAARQSKESADQSREAGK